MLNLSVLDYPDPADPVKTLTGHVLHPLESMMFCRDKRDKRQPASAAPTSAISISSALRLARPSDFHQRVWYRERGIDRNSGRVLIKWLRIGFAEICRYVTQTDIWGVEIGSINTAALL